jgi:hypothetical protein
MTRPARSWHLCDGTGATTYGRWRSLGELVAATRASYGDTPPAWLGRPCDLPLIKGGYRHDLQIGVLSDR